MTKHYRTLRQYKDGEGVTYQELGELLGITQSYAFRLVNLERRPSLRVAVRISEVTGISVQRLNLAKVA